MADSRVNNYTREYMDGNAVRVLYPERLPEPKRRQENKPARRRAPKRQANRISLSFALFSAAAGVILMIIAVGCISVQSQLTARMDNIGGLEKALVTLQDENEQLETEIALLCDATYIYETATVKLGMVPADDSRIIYYDKTESEYVRQYEYIPGQ